MGARPMKRLLRKEIEDPLSMELLSNAGNDFNQVSIEFSSNRLKVKLVKVTKEKEKEKELVLNKRFV